MIPQDKNIQERLGVAIFLALALAALLIFAKANVTLVTGTLIFTFAALAVMSNRWLKTAIDPE